MNNTARLEALDNLYAGLPKIECKRLCQQACGPIMLTPLERRRIVSETGRIPPIGPELSCPLLRDGACSVYEIRPAICRLWGLVDRPTMRCPHGCVPERWLSDPEAHAVLAAAERLGAGICSLSFGTQGFDQSFAAAGPAFED